MIDQNIANRLAVSRQALDEAEAAHTQAVQAADRLSERLHDTRARQAAITRARLEGECTQAESAEFVVLAADAEALETMLAEARTKAAAFDTNQARQELANAELLWAQHQKHAQFEALKSRTLEIEATLVECIAELVTAGRGLGHQLLGQNWRMSPDLDRIVRLAALPERFNC